MFLKTKDILFNMEINIVSRLSSYLQTLFRFCQMCQQYPLKKKGPDHVLHLVVMLLIIWSSSSVFLCLHDIDNFLQEFRTGIFQNFPQVGFLTFPPDLCTVGRSTAEMVWFLMHHSGGPWHLFIPLPVMLTSIMFLKRQVSHFSTVKLSVSPL